ncbi:hypothetical protein [Streptosporangium subroseum]|uniref:hypothetical protein n=1 Tax=Streptosporangium subroseum TaxID=106412 RepID=UPI0030903742|nr:hypothetical protein OHB15_06260 [Streptosporangium subroseum]
MGSGHGWELIKIYSTLYGLDEGKLTRAQIEQKLKATDPDRLEQAGKAFLAGSELLGGKSGGNGGGEFGIQAAISSAAKQLAEAWSGEDAAEVQTTLRKLHATAGALGDAMLATGVPLSWYAERLRHYRDTIPAAPLPGPGQSRLSSGPEGVGGGTIGAPPAIIDPDKPAQTHLRNFNKEIEEINATLADGLAFDLPSVEPIAFAPKTKAPSVTIDTSYVPHTRSEGVWSGGYDNGQSAGQGGSGAPGGQNGSAGTGGAGGSGTPGGQDGAGGSGGQDGSGTPGGSDTPGGQDGTGGPGDQGDPGGQDGPGGTDVPGGSNGEGGWNDPDPQDGTGPEAPPVIGGADDPSRQTQLASDTQGPWNAGPPTGSQTGLNAPATVVDSRPATAMGPNLLNHNGMIGSAQEGAVGARPPGAGFGAQGPGTGPGTGFGGQGAGAGGMNEAGVLRAGTGTTGSSMMPFMPGSGAGGEDEQERDRTIYSPEGDVWASQHETIPPLIC